MEARLRPVNGLLGLCQQGELNPSPLAAAGFRVVGLEVPVGVQGDQVVVDVVLFHDLSGLFLACESKSGTNVTPSQSQRYARINAADLVHVTAVDLSGGRRPTVAPLHVCLEEHSTRFRFSLKAAGVSGAVLAVGRDHVELFDPCLGPPVLAAAMTPARVDLQFGVPRIIPCDDQSPKDVVRPQVKAVLVQHLARGAEHVAVQVLAHETLAHLVLYGEKARKAFVRTVDTCAQELAAAQPTRFEYIPGTRSTGAREPLVRFLRSPEDNDNRGRTQGYQALARDGQARRRTRAPDPDQLDLFPALGRVDNSDEQDDTGLGDTVQVDDGEEGT